MRQPGKISPSRAARILGVHTNTIYHWCRAACEGRPKKIKLVERNPVTGYYWLSLEEVQGLKITKVLMTTKP